MIPALNQAVLDPTMRGRKFQVYVHLCSRLDPFEYRHIKFAAESRALGIGLANFSRVVGHLVKRGYLEAVPDRDDQRRHYYRLMLSVEEPT